MKLCFGSKLFQLYKTAGENLDDIYFQQDGAPPHYGVNVRQHLDEVFPNRWIGRRVTLSGQLGLRKLEAT